MLDGRQGCSHDILVLLSRTPPYCVNQVVLQWVFLIYCPQIGELQRPLDQLPMRILYIYVL